MAEDQDGAADGVGLVVVLEVAAVELGIVVALDVAVVVLDVSDELGIVVVLAIVLGVVLSTKKTKDKNLPPVIFFSCDQNPTDCVGVPPAVQSYVASTYTD